MFGRVQVCAVCERDVCDMLIFKSDAHRAKAIKHCMQVLCSALL